MDQKDESGVDFRRDSAMVILGMIVIIAIAFLVVIIDELRNEIVIDSIVNGTVYQETHEVVLHERK